MSQPLTPDTLVYGLITAGDPQLSPDGTRVLYTRGSANREDGATTAQLWCCGADGGDSSQLTWSGESNSGGRWSPDGQWIAFISSRTEKSGIFVLPANGPGEAREVTRHAQAIGDLAWSPDGTRLAYTTSFDPSNPDETPRPARAAPAVRVTRRIDYKQDNRGYLDDVRTHVFVVEVDGGARRRVSEALCDHGVPQWSPDGRRLAVKVATHNGLRSRLGLIEEATASTILVGPEQGSVGTWAWSPTGDRIVYTCDEADTLQLDVYLYDVASATVRRLTDTLAVAPDTGFPTILPPAQPVWIDDRHVLFHALERGASLLATVDCETGAYEAIHRWTAMHSGLSADAARRRLVQVAADLDSVGEVAIVDRTTGESRRLTGLNAALFSERPPAQWEKLDLRRRDTAIDAWLLKPPGFDPARRYPLILDVHGGPHSYYGYGFNAVQQCLAGAGFLVVFANPRGSGSCGGAFARRVVGDWGGEDFADLMAVVDTMAARPSVDPDRLGIFGYSYGGYMTSWTIGHTDRFKAAVCGAPCFDLESFYGTSDIGHIFGEFEFGSAPHAGREWYAAHSPSTFAHRARTPTLIIHGEADERCPIGQGEQMFITLTKVGCPVTFARYPGGSHLFMRNGPPEHREDVLTRIRDHFTHYLGGPA